jgi:hypothetical protein
VTSDGRVAEGAYVARLASGVIDRSRVRAWSSRTARACRWRRTRRARRRRRTARRALPPLARHLPHAAADPLSRPTPTNGSPAGENRRPVDPPSGARKHPKTLGSWAHKTQQLVVVRKRPPPWGGGGTDPKRREMKARRGDGGARGSPFLFPICTPLSTVVQDHYYF